MFLTLAVGAATLLALPQQDTVVAVSPGTRLALHTHTGSITVQTWDRNAVQVAGDGSRARLGVEVTGNLARIVSRGRRGPVETDYRITVPAWMDLELSTVDGDIRVTGLQAQAKLTSVEGDVILRGGRDFVAVHSVEGEVLVENVTGRVEVNSVEGAIRLLNVNGPVYAEAVDGDITMDGIQSADVGASTVDGQVVYRGTIQPRGRYRLGSHDGDVTLEVASLDAVIEVSTFAGGFEACGHQPVVTGNQGRNRRRFQATVGNGSAQVDLESFDGTIHLVKPGCRPGSGK